MTNRRATSADVARLAGVSRTTVSFVLNERAEARIGAATRARVLEAAEQLGYRAHGPARQLAEGATRTLALVLRRSAEQVAMDPLLPETLRGLTDTARAAGYRVQVAPLAAEPGLVLDLLRSGEVDGLVISGPRVEDERLDGLDDPTIEELPIVVHGSLPGSALPSVDVDNGAGARQAVDHLIALGHRQIACITNAPLGYTSARERLDGYRAALSAAGIPHDPRLEAIGDFDPPSGGRAMAELLGRGVDFTAAFVAGDSVALGAIAALRESGRGVPRDISVVGFDDIPLAAYVDPPLTTVRLPARDLGAQAARVLLDRLAALTVPARTVLATRLVVRGSAIRPTVAPAPAAALMGR
ncbi:MAG TPA: LacI family DNA-binding transcriptional regulator [Candidatus Limnocylindrales bacterium]|nr:LacI family DNA-binding transcriptional regulator [Candidatus Limnocylindrales bacterium]